MRAKNVDYSSIQRRHVPSLGSVKKGPNWNMKKRPLIAKDQPEEIQLVGLVTCTSYFRKQGIGSQDSYLGYAIKPLEPSAQLDEWWNPSFNAILLSVARCRCLGMHIYPLTHLGNLAKTMINRQVWPSILGATTVAKRVN